MRLLKKLECCLVSAATSHPKIEPRSRWFTDAEGLETHIALIEYTHEHYGNIPYLNMLPPGFMNDISELYFRTISKEDAFWQYAYFGAVGLASMGASFTLGYAYGRVI